MRPSRFKIHYAVLLASLGWSFFLLVCSYAFFKRLERGFSDRV